jgi:hypothetical protein
VRKSAGHRAKWNAESASVGCSAITCVGQHNAPVRGVARTFVRAARPDRRRASCIRVDHNLSHDVLDIPLRAGRVFAAPASLNSRKSSVIRAAQYFGLTASHHIPLGSGVTEAACKTIFTQRLKLSGMRWSSDGARTILNLRVILLSRTWSATYAAHLVLLHPHGLRTYATNRDIRLQIAA